MKLRALGLAIVAVVLWATPGVAARKSLHTRFFFSLTGRKSYWTETALAVSPLGSFGGWSCTAGTIDLWQSTMGGNIYKAAEIKCVDTNGTEITISTMCTVAEEERPPSQDVKLHMKNAESVHASIMCYTRRE